AREAAIITGTSQRTNREETTRGVASADMPITTRMLKMLLPTTLPRATSASPEIVDPTVTASSGELVPKATTVSPTTRGESPIETASLDAPRTRISAPATSRTSPATKRKSVHRVMVMAAFRCGEGVGHRMPQRGGNLRAGREQ